MKKPTDLRRLNCSMLASAHTISSLFLKPAKKSESCSNETPQLPKLCALVLPFRKSPRNTKSQKTLS